MSTLVCTTMATICDTKQIGANVVKLLDEDEQVYTGIIERKGILYTVDNYQFRLDDIAQVMVCGSKIYPVKVPTVYLWNSLHNYSTFTG